MLLPLTIIASASCCAAYGHMYTSLVPRHQRLPAVLQAENNNVRICKHDMCILPRFQPKGKTGLDGRQLAFGLRGQLTRIKQSR
jgi:hypothetical protein